jgi:ADP-dependent NAD(P)H-hydrate dehydratase
VKPIDDALLQSWPLPDCPAHADKVHRGTVLVVAGGVETAGAALLAGTAALRAGAGRLTVLTGRPHAAALAVALPEARVIASIGSQPAAPDVRIDASKADAVLIGPGLAEKDARAFAKAFIANCTVPVILDAGAIPALRDLKGRRPVPLLITPHTGELAHLEAISRDDVERDPAAAARVAADRWNAGVVLKGAVSYLVVPGEGQWRHDGGNAGLATSGSGDVLAGLIAGLAARGASLAQAAAWGVALHARAGDILSRRFGPIGYLARELAVEAPALLQSMAGQRATAARRRGGTARATR